MIHGVPVDACVDAMDVHWTAKLGNVSSSALRKLWRAHAETLNAQIQRRPGDPWPVFPAEMGTGKTEGLKTYCTLLPHDEHHPGVLVVVPRIAQAKEFVRDVTERSGVPAYAFHSQIAAADRTRLDVLVSYPVLAITHEAYSRGLDAIAHDAAYPKWDVLTRFRPHGIATSAPSAQRKLVIIDEALNVIGTASVTRRDLSQLQRDLPRVLTARHPIADDAIAAIAEHLRQSERSTDHFPVSPAEWLNAEPREVGEAITAMLTDDVTVPADRHGASASEKRDTTRKTLAALRRLLQQPVWIYNRGASPMLTTAWLLLPDDADTASAVILDATARQNLLYQHHPRFVVIEAPTARDYSPVTLHVAHEQLTGKDSVGQNVLPITQSALASIRGELGDDAAASAKALVLTGKENTNALKGLVRTGFRHVSLAHWGNVDGSNEWDDHAVVLVVSLPYHPDHAYLNTFHAMKEPLDAVGLNNPPDLVREFRQSQIAVDLAQAINRAQCRRVIDGDGRCAPTHVYLRLPNNDRKISAKRLVEELQGAMPGVRVEPWAPDPSAQLKGAMRAAGPALLGFAASMKAGDTAWSTDVRKRIDMQGPRRKRQWMRLVNDMTTDSRLAQALKGVGVVYRTLPRGTSGKVMGALVRGREAAKVASHR